MIANDEAPRKHADGSVCKASSPETCPFNKKAEKAETEITGNEISSGGDFDDFWDEMLDQTDYDARIPEKRLNRLYEEYKGEWEDARANGANMGRLMDKMSQEIDAIGEEYPVNW